MLKSEMIKEAREEIASWRKRAPAASIMADTGVGSIYGAGGGALGGLLAALIDKGPGRYRWIGKMYRTGGLLGGASGFTRGVRKLDKS